MADEKQMESEQEAPKTDACEQCGEYLNNWKRAQADYDNLRRQQSREKDEFATYATFRSAEAFLPAMDHFAEAMRHEPTEQNWKAWVMGVKFIRDEFDRAMQELGVKRIDSLGKTFDPAKHESVGSRKEEGKESGLVLEEKQPGFEMNGKVLRAAKVIVSE